jgi:hypothetical protein
MIALPELLHHESCRGRRQPVEISAWSPGSPSQAKKARSGSGIRTRLEGRMASVRVPIGRPHIRARHAFSYSPSSCPLWQRYACAASLTQADGDGLLRGSCSMLSFSNVINLFADELPCRSRRRFPFLEVLSCPTEGLLFRHESVLLSSKDAQFAKSDVSILVFLFQKFIDCVLKNVVILGLYERIYVRSGSLRCIQREGCFDCGESCYCEYQVCGRTLSRVDRSS